MQINRTLLFLLSILICQALSANMPPPQFEPVTNYYFGNIDSLSEYNFFIKNSENNKTIKIKQNASFVVNPKKNGIVNKLEVWAVSKQTKLQSNVVTLYVMESYKPLADNSAHYAVTLSFDKSKALVANFTQMTPKCYSKKKKNQLPFVVSLTTPDNSNLTVIVSFFSILFLTLLYFIKNRPIRKQYA